MHMASFWPFVVPKILPPPPNHVFPQPNPYPLVAFMILDSRTQLWPHVWAVPAAAITKEWVKLQCTVGCEHTHIVQILNFPMNSFFEIQMWKNESLYCTWTKLVTKPKSSLVWRHGMEKWTRYTAQKRSQLSRKHKKRGLKSRKCQE